MTGALDAARACIQRSHTDAAATIRLVDSYAERLGEVLAQLSSSGPLGDSDDPHLQTCRGHLTRARQRLTEAAQHLDLARGALTRLVERAFPP